MNPDCLHISSSNYNDYRKIHWWLLLLLVTLGSSILMLLFKFSWIVLIFLLFIFFNIRRQFQIEIVLCRSVFSIRKKFAGLKYAEIRQPFIEVFLFEQENLIKFRNIDSDLFIGADGKNLVCQNRKISKKFGNQKESAYLFNQLKSALKTLNLNCHYIKRIKN